MKLPAIGTRWMLSEPKDDGSVFEVAELTKIERGGVTLEKILAGSNPRATVRVGDRLFVPEWKPEEWKQIGKDHTPSELERWAAEDPDRLIAALQSGDLDPPVLTFGAEAAGALPTERIAPVLLRLLEHPSPLVREGAVYGITSHTAFDGVAKKLRQMAATDPSPGVRMAAREVVEDLAS